MMTLSAAAPIKTAVALKQAALKVWSASLTYERVTWPMLALEAR